MVTGGSTTSSCQAGHLCWPEVSSDLCHTFFTLLVNAQVKKPTAMRELHANCVLSSHGCLFFYSCNVRQNLIHLATAYFISYMASKVLNNLLYTESYNGLDYLTSHIIWRVNQNACMDQLRTTARRRWSCCYIFGNGYDHSNIMLVGYWECGRGCVAAWLQ